MLAASWVRTHPFMKNAELELNAHTHRFTLNPIHIASFSTA
jgi:hypothetical protein